MVVICGTALGDAGYVDAGADVVVTTAVVCGCVVGADVVIVNTTRWFRLYRGCCCCC